jgi:FAD/FMN-containing dehydrogenase
MDGPMPAPVAGPADVAAFVAALRMGGFRGSLDGDPAARAAMATDNSVYRILPVLVAAPMDGADACTLVRIAQQPEFAGLALTARGGGIGTNGQSLNSGVVVDLHRHMNRILAVDVEAGWADVEPGVVLDQLNDHLAGTGLFFTPETSTASRCTIGGMVSTDASGKGSRLYGKTADNVLGLTAIVGAGIAMDSLGAPLPAALGEAVERACDAGRDALLAHVPRLSRRFSGYDLERARRGADVFEWWRLFIGAEGKLGLVTRIRVRLIRRPAHRRLVLAGFESFRHALDAVPDILVHEPLAVECLDDWVKKLAADAGLLTDLPAVMNGAGGRNPTIDFIEFAGDDPVALDARVAGLGAALSSIGGYVAAHVASDVGEIRRLWAVRSASVGLLGRGRWRPGAGALRRGLRGAT